jgi:hypothetical protein
LRRDAAASERQSPASATRGRDIERRLPERVRRRIAPASAPQALQRSEVAGRGLRNSLMRPRLACRRASARIAAAAFRTATPARNGRDDQQEET